MSEQEEKKKLTAARVQLTGQILELMEQV